MGDYNAAIHHVGLKDEADSDTYGFTLVGQYSKELQREALGGQDFGGSTDLLGHALSASRVTQDDFTGGAYSEDWTKDAAMFSDCTGFLPQLRSKALATVPPLVRKHLFNPAVQTNAPAGDVVPHSFFMVAGSIYAAFAHGILRYEIGTDTATWATLYAATAGYGGETRATLVHAEYNSNDQVIYTLWDPYAAGHVPFVARIKTDLTDTSVNSIWHLPAGTASFAARGMEVRDTSLVVAVGNVIYSGDPPDNPTVTSGSVKWTRIGRLPGRWRASIPYSGLTYILCTDGAFKTSIVAFDGTSLLPIVTFPFSLEGKAICEYAGRLYVGGVGTDENGGEHYAELYEVTGASVRLIRSFAPVANRAGATWPHTVQALAVAEGLLWWSQAGTRLMTYDITSDGVFGSAQFQSVPATFDVTKMVTGRGRLWHWGHDTALPATYDGIYRLAQPADSGTISAYTATLTTGDFAWEPGVKKRWSQLTVLTRYVAAGASYSVDGGSTWTALTAATTTSGVNYLTTFDLHDVPVSTFIRFRITLSCGTDCTNFKELLAYTFTFVALETGKRGWSFTILCAENIEGRDGVSWLPDVTVMADRLWNWTIGKTRLLFTDLNGDTAHVQIAACREVMPVIGPNITGADGVQPEAHFALSLIEV